MRLSPDRGADADIELARGGTNLQRHGERSSLVPNTDRIHINNVAAARPRPSACNCTAG